LPSTCLQRRKAFFETLIALVLHLVPTLIVVVLLVFAWRREMIGAIAFAGLAITYVVVMWGRGFPWATYAIISGALLLNSFLFFLSWRQRLSSQTADQQPPGEA